MLSLDDNLFDSIEFIIVFNFECVVIVSLFLSLEHFHGQASREVRVEIWDA